jgi:hypothetical protein
MSILYFKPICTLVLNQAVTIELLAGARGAQVLVESLREIPCAVPRLLLRFNEDIQDHTPLRACCGGLMLIIFLFSFLPLPLMRLL